MDQDRVDELTERAAEALTSGEPLLALALADQLAANNPEDLTARVLRAHALLATGSVEESLREGRVAIRLDPTDEDAHYIYALACWRDNNVVEAHRAFKQVVELSGRSSLFMAQYAWFLASERPPRAAVRVAERLLDENPQLATAWAALGLAQFRLQRADQAEKSLRKALQIDPQSPEAQSAMIRLLKRRGEHRQAEALQDILVQASKRYSLFVESSPESLSKEEKQAVSPLNRSTLLRQLRSRQWWPLRASLLVLVLVTLGLAISVWYLRGQLPAN